MQTQMMELYQNLSEVTDENERRELLLGAAEFLAEALAAPLQLHGDEVALQVIVQQGNSLRFLFPRVLYESGATFPISGTSIAGSAVKLKRTNIDNHVGSKKHLVFYEKLNTGVRPPMPIQKMATVPLISRGTVVGIAQLSRRAQSPEEAGPDFKEEDFAAIREVLTVAAAMIEDHIFNKI